MPWLIFTRLSVVDGSKLNDGTKGNNNIFKKAAGYLVELMSVSKVKYNLRGTPANFLVRGIGMILCLTFILRVLTLNFSTLCFFTPWDPVDEIQTVIVHGDEPEYSQLNIPVAVSAAMIKDESESKEDSFLKSSKYPVLLTTFTALSQLFTAPITASRLLAYYYLHASCLSRHLSCSVLRI